MKTVLAKALVLPILAIAIYCVKAAEISVGNTSVSLSADVTGTLPVANGGTGGTGFASGAVIVSTRAGSTDVLDDDSTQLFWNFEDDRLGVGTNAPTSTIHVAGSAGIGSGATISSFSTTGALTLANGAAFTQTSASASLSGLNVSGATSLVGSVSMGSTLTVTGNAFSVGITTIAVTGGAVGIGTSLPGTKAHISSGTLTLDGNTSPSLTANNQVTFSSAVTVTGDLNVAASTLTVKGGIISMPANPAAILNLNATTLVANATTIDVFWNQDTVTQNMHLTTSSNTITVPPGGGGLYAINVNFFLSACTAGVATTKILKNGSNAIVTAQSMAFAGVSCDIMNPFIMNLAAGDTIKIQFSHGNAGAIDLYSSAPASSKMSMVKIR